MAGICCPACGHTYLPVAHPGTLNVSHLSVCPHCHGLNVDRRGRHMGEMLRPGDDTADPDEWGGIGWA